MPTRALHYLFVVLLSATVVAALQAVGLVLVIALLITPGASAYLLSERLSRMMAIASVIGLLSAVSGIYVSFYLDVAAGPAIVLAASGFFLVAYLFAPREGVVMRQYTATRARRRAAEEDLLKILIKTEREQPPPHAGVCLVDIEGALAAQTAIAVVKRLARRGLIDSSQRGVRLTAPGEREAVRIVRTHRLLERYLHDAERIPLQDLHKEADRLEHEIDAAQVEDIARSIGAPETDPHGHRIPRSADDLALRELMPLSQAPPGTRLRVEMISDRDEAVVRELAILDLLPAREVTILERTTTHLIVSLRGQRVEVPAVLADDVLVAHPSSDDRAHDHSNV